MSLPAYQTLYDETNVDTTVETKVGSTGGRDEMIFDSSGTGVATIKTKNHPDGNYKTVATLTNDDQIGIMWAPYVEVTGVGIVNRFIVAIAAPPSGA